MLVYSSLPNTCWGLFVFWVGCLGSNYLLTFGVWKGLDDWIIHMDFYKPMTSHRHGETKKQISCMNLWINNNQPMILRMRCVVGSRFLPCWRQLLSWPYMVAGGPRSESPCRNATSVTLEMVCWGQRLSRRNGWTIRRAISNGWSFRRKKKDGEDTLPEN